MSEISCEFWLRVDDWGHRIVTVFGGVICLTLLYLTVFTNQRVLAEFRLILFFCSLADIQCWLISSYVHMSMDVTEGTELIVVRAVKPFNGKYSPSTQRNLALLFVYGGILVILMLPMNCYCRYVLIKRSELRLRTTVSAFGLACFVAAFMATWVGFTVSWNEDGRFQSSSCISQDNRGIIMYTKMTDPFCRMYFLFAAILFVVIYAASILLARRTFFHIKERKQSFDAKALSVQRQLARIMVMQGALPILTSIGPALLNVGTMLLNFEVGQIGFVIYGVFNWIPLVNPLATIIIVKPYRRHMLRIFSVQRFFNVSSTNSNIVRPATTQTTQTRD
ncbi:unnamed protein product [Bursaphelenchus xylophilus]|uniref:(pine wood nematode) hypothetical protein n=1 Tax=Bursaphelenchus xylophilus TaxID=6326 RepID=A0A1I7RIU0_BURXY|nr:unnamed protein product [Bursaphelenchus xylophilus]CAG9119090.1 unnamed protein product [Bursaphelenchus xylophilus]